MVKGGGTCQRIVCGVKLTRKNWGGAKRRREEMTNISESFGLESILAETCARHQEGP